MKNRANIQALLLLSFHFLVFVSLAQGTTLMDGWTFSRDGGKTWQAVRIPHDWAIYEKVDPKGDGETGKLPWRGIGDYQRKLTFTAEDKRLLADGGRAYLIFDGVMCSSRVSVNGHSVGGSDYGYLGFTVDITPFVNRDKENLIEVHADTTHLISRWYPGGGIYRRVQLKVYPKNHVLPNTLRITAQVILAAPKKAEKAEVKVSYETPAGPTNYTFTLSKPHLWDVEDPYLYTLELPGESVRYGVRKAQFTAEDGFHLNGRRVQLRGVNLHSDLGLLGMAFEKAAARRQLCILREMGVNAIRTSHNPPAPEFLDLCDEMGFVVWDECFDKWDETAGRQNHQNVEDYIAPYLRALVRRDRIHPCVVIWSISNEIWEWDEAHPIRNHFKWADRGPTGQTQARNSFFAAAVRTEDDSRPVGCGNRPFMNEERILNLNLWKDLDVVGWNYLGAYAAFHKRRPNVPVVYSESASAVSSQGWFSKNLSTQQKTVQDRSIPHVDGRDLLTSIDIADVEFNLMDTHRYVAGEFVWTGFDYLGEPIPFREEARSSYFGCVDLMGMPKDRFYLYRAHWRRESFTLHITPHWTWPGAETNRQTVCVYSNGDAVELFVNGRSLGLKKRGEKNPFKNDYYKDIGKYRFTWVDVHYEPGELKAVAWQNGKCLGETAQHTAGDVTHLAFVPEVYEDFIWVRVDAMDAKGVVNPWAENRVTYAVQGAGEIVAIGNSDPTCNESFAPMGEHSLFAGHAMVLIRRTGKGPITLTTKTAELPNGSITLH